MNKVRNFLRLILSRIYTSTIPRFPAPTAHQQSMGSWAKVIRSYDAVPVVYKDFFEPLLKSSQAFPYVVLTPSYEGFIPKATEKLICDFEKAIYVLERNGNTFNLQCFPLGGISCVEVRTILLDSSIKICGMTNQGLPASATFRFNSITDYLFKPILQRIRRATVDPASSASISELEKFNPWSKVNYKFMNYAKRSLLAGEKVIHTILQPEIRETILKVLGKTYIRVISPTLVSILTNRELIMIREERWRGGDDKYGGIWDYIPLNKIMRLSLSEIDNCLLAFSINLTEGTSLEYLFQASAKPEINRLQDRFLELMIA